MAIDEAGRLVYSFYDTNQGSPLATTIGALLKMLESFPGLTILGSTVTGYGEGLLKAALHVDHGEIETISHYKVFVLTNHQCSITLGCGVFLSWSRFCS